MAEIVWEDHRCSRNRAREATPAGLVGAAFYERAMYFQLKHFAGKATTLLANCASRLGFFDRSAQIVRRAFAA